MRWKSIKQWFFIETSKANASIWKRRSTSPTPQDRSFRASHLLYLDCATLPLKKFIACLCEDNLQALVISGKPTLPELQEAWWNIYAEFIDLCAEADNIYANRLQSDVNMFKARLLKIKLMVGFLRCEYDLQYVDELRTRGFRYKFEWDNQKQYHKDLDSTLAGTKHWQLQLQLREAELEAYLDAAKGEKPSPLYFTQILIRLSDHAGFQLNPEVLTTAEFALRKKAYTDYADKVNKQKNAQRR
jgi:hypothetical protein